MTNLDMLLMTDRFVAVVVDSCCVVEVFDLGLESLKRVSIGSC